MSGTQPNSAIAAATPAEAVRRPLPIALFSIPLGLAGLGGAWAAAADLLGASAVPANAAYTAAAFIWVAFTGMYAIGTLRSGAGGFRTDLRHPLFGPLTAYIPVIAVLLIAHYTDNLGASALWLTFGAVAALAVNAAALVAQWLDHPLERDSFHPGYFLPVTAGPFIASIGLISVDEKEAAIGAFGIGAYFWLLIGAAITGRLLFGAPLPQTFRPVLSILLSPPATASLAWFAITDGEIDHVQTAIGAVTLFTLLIQLFFLRDYLRLSFTSLHWVFTFPLAVLGNIGVRWAAELRFPGWEPAAWCVLAVATAAISAIAVGTLRDLTRWARGLRIPASERTRGFPGAT